jgi:hypothetical protein
MLIAASGVVAQQNPEIRRIDADSTAADAMMKRHPSANRIFADVSDATKEENASWREFKTSAERRSFKQDNNLTESAILGQKAGKVVVAAFMIEAPSGDLAQFNTYYFRLDGTLAKINSVLNTFHGNVSARRIFYYNREGQILDQRNQYFDLKTARRLKEKPDFADEAIPRYMTVRQLPFYALL